eukprot:CAMPEP_0177682206 /NCGR_PEP_ID=MMETSP0447-20121125/31132_1 /TAXON_ID=0 /ORGANISM="Stygamoeba regulata, Strain BSH-02190019" /LENGTH=211 /DNA_ID=CAMNT_0019191687 /DNA_START=218 /DNA_END=853 /DNA_ORIENTATION=-
MHTPEQVQSALNMYKMQGGQATTVLELNEKELGDEGDKSNSSFRVLDLRWNNIQDDGAKALAAILTEKRVKLETIRLGGNNIGADGATALANALKSNNTVTSLDLKGNFIAAAGAQAFAEYLKTNGSITDLNLGANRIGPVGGQAIGEALKENKKLATLDLQANGIGDVGATAILDSLNNGNTALTNLEVERNNINEDLEYQLSKRIGRKK